MISKVIGMSALCTLLLTTQAASADLCVTDPCCTDWCCTDWCPCGDWEVGGHALYWTPVTCQWDYVAEGDNAPGVPITQIDVSSIGCSADWGFRLFANYTCDCSIVGLSYQWFDSKATQSRSGGILRIHGGNEEMDTKVDARARIKYQNADLRVGKYLHRACGCNVYLFGNVRWVDLSYARTVVQTRLTTGTVQRTTEKSEFQGGALGIGLAADYDVWCDFGLFGDANLLGALGERSTTNISFDSFSGEGGQSSAASYPSDTCILPEVDFRIGINYRYTCGCWTVVGEVGYEVDYFWDTFAFPETTTFLNGNTGWRSNCENIGFAGLFFGGRILF